MSQNLIKKIRSYIELNKESNLSATEPTDVGVLLSFHVVNLPGDRPDSNS